MKKGILATLLLLSFHLFGQTAAIQSFTAIPGQNDITLQWTINPNYSCSYMGLEYSTDSLFSFPTVIYTDVFTPSSSVLSYKFTHSTADKSNTNYYRLNMGSCGTSAIISANVGSKLNYKLYPNPFNDQATVIFNNPNNAIVYLYIFDHNGQLLKKSNPFQGNTLQLLREGMNVGLYYFAIASSSDLLAWGKFYVKDN